MDCSFCPVLDEMIRTRQTVGQPVASSLSWEHSTINNLALLRTLMLERKPA